MSHLNDQIVRLYDTVFDRAPDAGGLRFWNDAADQGQPLHDIAGLFITAPEFAATYGQPDNRSFVQSIYHNVLDRAGEPEGVEFWTHNLDIGVADRAWTTIGFSESYEHQMRLRAPAPAPVVGTVTGSDGSDTLAGGPGDDTITGGRGDDLLTGGPGNDVFLFHRGDGTADRITDFGTGDRLRFPDISPKELTWSALADGSGVQVLYGGLGAAGATHGTIYLEGVATLTPDAFIFG